MRETLKTVEELFKAIDNLPDTIASVKVPTSLSYFNPSAIEIKPGDDEDWRSKIKDTVRDALALPKGLEVDGFVLRSYYGGSGATDPYYISYDSEGLRKFADAMSSGKYGALD